MRIPFSQLGRTQWVRLLDFGALVVLVCFLLYLGTEAYLSGGDDFRGYYAAARVVSEGGDPYDYNILSQVLLKTDGFMGNNPYYYPLWWALSTLVTLALISILVLPAVWAVLGIVVVARLARFAVMHLSGTVYAAAGPQGLTAQFDPRLHYGNAYDELIAFLEEHGGTRRYTNYWVAFKLAFLSDERMILDVALPYKASLHVVDPIGRYPAYDAEVAYVASVIRVTGNQPELDEVLRERFRERVIAYLENEVGPCRVFYNLSVLVTPATLDMGQ